MSANTTKIQQTPMYTQMNVNDITFFGYQKLVMFDDHCRLQIFIKTENDNKCRFIILSLFTSNKICKFSSSPYICVLKIQLTFILTDIFLR